MLQRPSGRSLLVAGLVAGLFIVASTAQVAARDVEDLKVSPASPTAERTYSAPPAANPSASLGDGRPLREPGVCKTATYCDTIDLNVVVPSDYEYFYSVVITLDCRYDDLHIPDYDVWLWALGPTQLKASGNDGCKESMSIDDPEPDLYFITANQFAGDGSPYHVKVRFVKGIKKPVKTKTTPASPQSGSDETGGFTGQPPDNSRRSEPYFPSSSFGETEPSAGGLGPVRMDLPQEDIDRGEFAAIPLAGETTRVPTTIHWVPARLLAGMGLLLVVALAAYVLLFLPRRRPSTPVASST